MKKKNLSRDNMGYWRGLTFVLVFVIIVVAGIVFARKFDSDDLDEMGSARIVWKRYSLPPANKDDIVRKALAEFAEAIDMLSKEGKADVTLVDKINEYRQLALTREQIEKDLRGLNGLEMAYVGQLHEGIGSDRSLIVEVQADIANIVLSNYDVLWAEDFSGGGVVTKENAWREFQKQFLQCSVPKVRADAREESARKSFVQSASMYASAQLLLNSEFKGEVRAADYWPVKAIQLRLLEYMSLESIHQPTPSSLDVGNCYPKIVMAFSRMRDIYILREVALNADKSKKNVLVFGVAHSENMAQLMANYGVKGTIIMPFPNNKN